MALTGFILAAVCFQVVLGQPTPPARPVLSESFSAHVCRNLLNQCFIFNMP